METINLNLLENSWSADVLLKNGQIISIWFTCWYSIKDIVDTVLSVSSDYPRFKK